MTDLTPNQKWQYVLAEIEKLKAIEADLISRVEALEKPARRKIQDGQGHQSFREYDGPRPKEIRPPLEEIEARYKPEVVK